MADGLHPREPPGSVGYDSQGASAGHDLDGGTMAMVDAGRYRCGEGTVMAAKKISAVVRSIHWLTLVIATATVGCDGSPTGPGPTPPTAPHSTSSPAVSQTAQAAAPPVPAVSADPMFSPGWAKQLPDGFVYFNDGLAKHGRAPLVAVVVPAAHGKRFYFAAPGEKITYFTPSLEQVFKVNAALLTITERESRIAKRVIEYRYQIVGIDDGNKRLFVNAFCWSHDEPRDRAPACPVQWELDLKTGKWVAWPPDTCPNLDWLRKPVIVDDGGACYFNFKVDPKTGAVSDLEVNGEA